MHGTAAFPPVCAYWRVVVLTHALCSRMLWQPMSWSLLMRITMQSRYGPCPFYVHNHRHHRHYRYFVSVFHSTSFHHSVRALPCCTAHWGLKPVCLHTLHPMRRSCCSCIYVCTFHRTFCRVISLAQACSATPKHPTYHC